MTTEKKTNENQSNPQEHADAQTESVTLTPEEKKQELLPDHAVRDPVVAHRIVLLKCHTFTLYEIRHTLDFSGCITMDTSALYLSVTDTGQKYG